MGWFLVLLRCLLIEVVVFIDFIKLKEFDRVVDVVKKISVNFLEFIEKGC